MAGRSLAWRTKVSSCASARPWRPPPRCCAYRLPARRSRRGQITAASELTGRIQLLVYDITTRRTVEVSPQASSVSYRAGVLWWSTGSQDSFLRHTLDLRTV